MTKSLLLASLLAIALTACSKKEETPAPAVEVNVTAPAAEAAPAAPAAPAAEAAPAAPAAPAAEPAPAAK